MDLFGKKKIRELEDKVERLEQCVSGTQEELSVLLDAHEKVRYCYLPYQELKDKYTHKDKTYSTESIKDLTIQEFFDFYFDGKPIKRKEEVDVEYRKGE